MQMRRNSLGEIIIKFSKYHHKTSSSVGEFPPIPNGQLIFKLKFVQFSIFPHRHRRRRRQMLNYP
jgi:hypothetical protein